MPKILITGASSGFGLATAELFLALGWEVVATMRTPQAHTMPVHDRLQILALDVTDAASIAQAVADAGVVDALVNNAGVGMLNVLEGVDIAKARELFETNVLGTMAMTQAVLPGMRARQTGVIVNISSSVTLRPFPALSVYSASKAAINAFTESLALEAAQFGIRTRLVLPGSAPTTAFGKNAVARMGMNVPAPYEAFVQDYFATMRSSTEKTQADDVAQAVWRAVTEPDAPMRLPAGADAETIFSQTTTQANG
ncbi:SDR family oxidoreductase [Mesorhizobium sangaii]|uniref:NADP-dependent 3-hydroxy acid dehydrogenase YdfG n=1 Tax=Mesorhizobium sangaii TaxID=505389 RepID=A0A841PKC2_9HYPH|nr:SDR family oxidoreductase [Mesorhizobium sangaii]MBB6408935.1 NADP-dependent 3-hydroxy acid dehydrogenase YdfG [Mesorhizobium sangaii]